MIKFPSNIIPSFQKEIDAQMTAGEVFGDLQLTSLLNKALEKIRAGQYSLSRDAAQELGVKTEGTFANAEWAAAIFTFECAISHPAYKQWASAIVRELPERLGIDPNEFLEMRCFDMWKKLAVVPAEAPEDRQQISHGAQGQTRKRGSHRDGTGHR